jgi:shikimate dehydrogenase
MDGREPPCDVPLDAVSPETVVLDLVYRPLETPLLAAARARGLRTIDGTRMLLHQGAKSFAMWTGHEAPLAVMEAALGVAGAAPRLKE